MSPEVYVAAIAAIAGILSTWLTVKGNRQLRPANGKTVAQTIERVENRVDHLIDIHLDPNRHP